MENNRSESGVLSETDSLKAVQAVGFIGLGNIGKPMARNLLGQQFEVWIHDLFPASGEELLASGAKWADSPKSMAQVCDVIGICVRDDADVRAVIEGPSGILAATQNKPKPQQVILSIHSTVKPETIREMAEVAAEKNISVIDAPITGGASGAENRTLCYMVGGDEQTLERCRAVFETSAKKIIYAGELGAGMSLKLCNNLLTYAEFIAVYEAMKLARAAGLDPAVLKAVGAANGNITEQMGMFLALHEFRPHMQAADFDKAVAGFTAVAEKDLSVALELAGSVGEMLPGCEKSLSLIGKVYADNY